MIGKTLAHYEIEGCLGEGGSGVVYRGRDLRLEREVAIKVLADTLRRRRTGLGPSAARGAPGFASKPSAHCRHIRPGGGGRLRVHRHGVC